MARKKEYAAEVEVSVPKVRKVAKKKVAKRMRKVKKAEDKVEKVMHEYKEGELHSGSKQGPKVKSRKQAIAIAMSEAGKSKGKKKKK